MSVENESGWIPFMIQQWNYYYRRFRDVNPVPMTKDPSDYMREQRLRFVLQRRRDGGRNLAWWGEDNLMWSNDFPHPNSTWPDSLKVIQRDLGHLAPEAQTKVLATNVCNLYGIDPSALPAGLAKQAQAAKAAACNRESPRRKNNPRAMASPPRGASGNRTSYQPR